MCKTSHLPSDKPRISLRLGVVEQATTIVVTAYQVCPAACTDVFQLQLISAFAEGWHDEGVSPRAWR